VVRILPKKREWPSAAFHLSPVPDTSRDLVSATAHMGGMLLIQLPARPNESSSANHLGFGVITLCAAHSFCGLCVTRTQPKTNRGRASAARPPPSLSNFRFAMPAPAPARLRAPGRRGFGGRGQGDGAAVSSAKWSSRSATWVYTQSTELPLLLFVESEY
jgi:hypothetical protein